MTARPCATPGCALPAVARGMCNAHYARARREKRKTEIAAPPEDRPATDYTRAACLDHDPELWFPDPADTITERYAKRICGDCPGKAACLDVAMRRERDTGKDSRTGIWGGLGPVERAKLARARRSA